MNKRSVNSQNDDAAVLEPYLTAGTPESDFVEASYAVLVEEFNVGARERRIARDRYVQRM